MGRHAGRDKAQAPSQPGAVQGACQRVGAGHKVQGTLLFQRRSCPRHAPAVQTPRGPPHAGEPCRQKQAEAVRSGRAERTAGASGRSLPPGAVGTGTHTPCLSRTSGRVTWASCPGSSLSSWASPASALSTGPSSRPPGGLPPRPPCHADPGKGEAERASCVAAVHTHRSLACASKACFLLS